MRTIMLVMWTHLFVEVVSLKDEVTLLKRMIFNFEQIGSMLSRGLAKKVVEEYAKNTSINS